jgi:hypothetical protein
MCSKSVPEGSRIVYTGLYPPPHPLYQTEMVLFPGVVWVAVRRKLGEPWDVRMGMEDWVEER